MLIDVSNVVKGAILHGKDKEFGRKVQTEDGKDYHVNSAAYGFETAVDFLNARMNRFGVCPKDMIFVVEGPRSKALRESISDTYKAGRKTLPQEQYDEINKCHASLTEQFLRLGARTVTQSGLEADDIIAYLAEKLPECVIISSDGDMQQLVTDRAHVFHDGKLDAQRYLHGLFPHRYTTLYKALVGDSSDNIKGARGFGEAAFRDFYLNWGDEGCDEMIRMIEQRCLEELHENVGTLKTLQKIVDDRENVYVSWALAKMYPDKVNTWRVPLKWQTGVVMEQTARDSAVLTSYFAKRKIVHAGNIGQSLDWFYENVKLSSTRYVGLDIETSSSDESDEWQARKVKKEEDAEDIGVDMLGHELTSVGLTFGANDNYSLYLTVDHKEAEGAPKNLTVEQAYEFVKLIPKDRPIIVHHSYFELTVLERHWGDLCRDNGWHGFLPNVLDTRILATYVDEDGPKGLKDLSLKELDYKQTTYEEVTQGRKMRELTAQEAFDYGTDDTRCTVALFNHYRMLLEIEGTWNVLLDVEQDPAYLTAFAFNQGTPISMERLIELEREDKAAYDAGWATVRDFLISRGWAGTVCPQIETKEGLTAAFVKEAYEVIAGGEWPTDECKARRPDKLAAFIESKGETALARAVVDADAGEVGYLNRLLEIHFSGEPAFNIDSPVQNVKLLYEVMRLPVRLRRKPTDAMRKAGLREGNPRTDDLAVQWAVQNDVKPGDAIYDVVKAFQAMKVSNTRRKLYYEPYKRFQHWTDNLVHAHMNQNEAATRRYSSSGPNLQQLPKHPKATGEPAKFREVFVPHHRRAVVVSLDFSGQELRLITDYSQDPNMLACYVGNDLKDMHTLTAAGILKKKALASRVQQLWTMAGRPDNADEAFALVVAGWKAIDYAGFKALKKGDFGRLYSTLRALGKKTNFTTEYGAQAPKLAETLLVPEDEAQQYIEAKYAAFPRAEAWKQEVTAEYRKTGVATTMLGAIRHLETALRSGNTYEIGKAERQAVNFKIQGSAAEQTKMAMGRVWRAGLCFKYDARFIAPVHDELVFSVGIDDLVAFLHEVHALMIAPYAGMQVPIVSSVSFGPNLGKQIEIGESVNEEAVNDALYYGMSADKYGVDEDIKALFPEEAPLRIAA